MSKTNSWYEASRNWNHQFPALTEDISTDVCVIGGGITGLCTAIDLAEAGYQVALLEARHIGWGASGRSGGQLLVGLGCEPEVIEQQMSFAEAKAINQISVQALALARERIKRYHIDCDLVEGSVFSAFKPRQMQSLQAWRDKMASYDYDHIQMLDKNELRQHIETDAYLGGTYDGNGAHLHPLNYTLGLARAAHELGVRIFENSPVMGIDQNSALKTRSPQGAVTSGYAVLAGNAYLSGIMPEIESRMMPVETYITATLPLSPERARALIPRRAGVCDSNFVLDYYRLSADNRLLFGGRASYSQLKPAQLEESLRARMLKIFPQLHDVGQEYTWGGNVAITLNRAPHFGRIGTNIYFAHGYSGHGMAMTGMAGRILTQAIRGQAEQFDLFSRIRHHRFPGGRWMRTPLLVLAMAWYRLLDLRP